MIENRETNWDKKYNFKKKVVQKSFEIKLKDKKWFIVKDV